MSWDEELGGWSWDDFEAEEYPGGGSAVEAAPAVQLPDFPIDDALMTYASFVAPIFKEATATAEEPYFSADVLGGAAGVGGKPTAIADGGKGGETWMQKLAKTLGFTSTNDFAKTMTPAVMTLAGSAIAGAANGYAANQKHLIDKQLATSQAAALEANAALAKSKANQAGLEGMKFNPGSGGLINAAWKPAPIVPPSQRTPA